MVKIVSGNILNAKENIICHQVNVQGVMGGGVARQLAQRFKGLEEFYARHCEYMEHNYRLLCGTVLLYDTEDKIIVNVFCQRPNFNTDYEAMRRALEYIKKWTKNNRISVAMPYGIGCGIANGDWDKVYKIIEEVFDDYEVSLYRLEEK